MNDTGKCQFSPPPSAALKWFPRYWFVENLLNVSSSGFLRNLAQKQKPCSNRNLAQKPSPETLAALQSCSNFVTADDYL